MPQENPTIKLHFHEGVLWPDRQSGKICYDNYLELELTLVCSVFLHRHYPLTFIILFLLKKKSEEEKKKDILHGNQA